MSGWRASKMDTPRILTKPLNANLNLMELLNIRPARVPYQDMKPRTVLLRICMHLMNC